MFAKNTKSDPTVKGHRLVTLQGVSAHISQEMHLTGDLESVSEILVDGTIDGNVKARKVTIGETANISGTIEAESARVGGTVKGQIHVRNLEITKTAKVVGDIIHQSLSIEAGAYFTGNVKRMDEEKQSPAIGEKQVSLVQDVVPDPVSDEVNKAVN